MTPKQRKAREAAWICFDCAEALGTRDIPGHCYTVHEDECGVCHETKMVTEPRDFWWPK